MEPGQTDSNVAPPMVGCLCIDTNNYIYINQIGYIIYGQTHTSLFHCIVKVYNYSFDRKCTCAGIEMPEDCSDALYVHELQKRARGPYRQKYKVPRQTLRYRNIKLARDGNQAETADVLFNTRTVGTSNSSQQLSNTESDNSDTDMQDPQSFDEEQANSSSQDVTSTDVIEPLDISGATSSSSTDVTTIQDSPENTGSYAHQKLYGASLMTVKSSCITINRFIHKYHLSKQAQEDLLSLQQQLLPTPNRLPYSLYRFRQVIDFGPDPMELHHYCIKCFYPASSAASTCSNPSCGAEVGSSYFIALSIRSQLRKLLSSRLHIYTTDGADVCVLHSL